MNILDYTIHIGQVYSVALIRDREIMDYASRREVYAYEISRLTNF